MAIMVGSARVDERGKYSGGTAGDQKQKTTTNDLVGEVSMQAMYNHSKGWYILRPKKIEHANGIALAMTIACNNANIGYSQSNRLGVITAGIASQVPTNADCSSLVRACIMGGAQIDPGNFNTANEAAVLAKTGLFENKIEYISQAKTPVYNGDILVTKTKGHTVVVVSGSPRSAQNTTNTPAVSFSAVGVDVSRYQGIIDWTKVKATGVSFAALKIINKNNAVEDSFERNWTGCTNAGIEIRGVYNYSYATTTDQAKASAQAVISALKGRKTTVWLDVEDNIQKNLGSKLIDIIIAYKDTIEKAGLSFGVYTGLSFYNTYISPYLNGLRLKFWIARYGLNNGTYNEIYKPNIKNMVCWQYTSRGNIAGINGSVDMNVWFGDAIEQPSAPMSNSSNEIMYKVKVTASVLNIRSGNGTSYPVVGKTTKGTTFSIFEEKDGWGRMASGWVSLKWVERI